MNPTNSFLIKDGSFLRHYHQSALPVAYAQLKVTAHGEKVVWNHDVYQEVGKAPKDTRYGILMERIKRIVNYLRCSGTDSSFASLSEVLRYFFSALKPTYVTIYKRTQRSLKEIAQEYAELKKGKTFTDVLIHQPFIREGLTLSMRGIALIAERLSRKSHLTNLHVCESLHTFQQQLKEISDDPIASRHAFVVPCHQYELNTDPAAVVEQHMLSVLVEKKDGRLHVCVLEPMVLSGMNVARTLALKKHLFRKPSFRFDPEEQVMAFAMRACSRQPTTFYHSLVRRQFGPNGGCSTFALRDAVNFLKNPAFFQEIELESGSGSTRASFESETVDGFQAILTLPPAFMLSTQSLSKIDEYIRSNPGFSQQKLGKRQLTLSESVGRRSYRELPISRDGEPKLLNKYIDERTAKYQEILLQVLKGV